MSATRPLVAWSAPHSLILLSITFLSDMRNKIVQFGDHIGKSLRHESHISGLVTTGNENDRAGCFASCSWEDSSSKDYSFGRVRIWKLNKDKTYDQAERVVKLCTPDKRWQQPLAMTWLAKHGQLALGLFDGTIALVSLSAARPEARDLVDNLISNDEHGTTTDRPITAIAAQPHGEGDEQLVVAGTMSGDLLLFSHTDSAIVLRSVDASRFKVHEVQDGSAVGPARLELRDKKRGTRPSEENGQGPTHEATGPSVVGVSNPLFPLDHGLDRSGESGPTPEEQGHTDAVRSIVWVGSNMLVSGSFDNRLLVWKVDPHRAVNNLQHVGELCDSGGTGGLRQSNRIDLQYNTSEREPNKTAHNGAVTALQAFRCTVGTDKEADCVVRKRTCQPSHATFCADCGALCRQVHLKTSRSRSGASRTSMAEGHSVLRNRCSDSGECTSAGI